MAPKYANEQSSGFCNYVRKVAMVGAAGRQGKYVVDELLKTGKHEVTAITRNDSTNTSFATGVKIAKVDYDSEESLVSALTGQDALIITTSVMAPPDTSEKLVKAAAKAGVPWILPNEWGFNSSDLNLVRDIYIPGGQQHQIHELIEELGVSSWIAISCGFWYEFSLSSGPLGYGFDVPNRTVILYDDGRARLSTSTLEQAGRAAARVLSMKILPEDEPDKDPNITDAFKNGHVFVESFLLSQRDMLAEVLKVTGTKESDWTVQHEPSKQRYEDGFREWKAGDMWGARKLLYARLFYPDEPGNFGKTSQLANDMLGLPKDDLSDRTRTAVEDAEALVKPQA